MLLFRLCQERYERDLETYRLAHSSIFNYLLHFVLVPLETVSALVAIAQVSKIAAISIQVTASIFVLLAARPKLAFVQLSWTALSIFLMDRMTVIAAVLLWLGALIFQVTIGHGLLEKKKPSFVNNPTISSVILSAALAWDMEHWIPVALRNLIYMNFITSPELTRAGPRKAFYSLHARNIETRTDDGALIRGFHLLPAGSTTLLHAKNEMNEESLLQEARLCILFFHGNCGTRLGVFKMRRPSGRVELCRALASHWKAHVICFDYRGFADSDNLTPSETGLALDAQAALRWVRTNAPHARIVLYGQSLGTAVATELAANARPCVNGLILDGPFPSVLEAAETYPFVGYYLIPTLRYFNYLEKTIEMLPDCRHESQAHKLPSSVPLLVVHKKQDEVVPAILGRKVFDLAHQAAARSASYNSFLLIDDDTKPTMRKHHVDAFTSPLWLIAVDHLIKIALGFDDSSSSETPFQFTKNVKKIFSSSSASLR
uniref:AB hydrolase-1 domain-containing protein n=1 Tax=Aureoumbra lagunensis TaxID=44058 RepID=A0A7S3K5R8_9STRA|mmetsp:Transcript_7716/g.10737  ORF Transcript_7716/g.10737 Transcript_7716/m.10737 type:complete len:488 (-) Transcript_7716:88-1551(-)